ncbi:MAG: GspH/FimT family pseudopilin [Proteobacteria bacterium]|nr:GspH/FimT family pseudopilin [Pseudomonadota bacterium]MBU1582586.1 GspH/FimT family pseudopilin [Pseudomonadota bacterium]MBU2455368.1 GspH/FimT family pseudopilin [Pseudomonadota bacterium]MBU2630209.1 GspH/FimT family pseudopilin [Pseudomonadota bacterium]
MKNYDGFTMIELLVVIGIISIAIAIAVPNLLTIYPDIRLKTAARQLMSNLQKARIMAIKNNTTVRLRFDSTVTPGRYYFDDDNDGAITPGEETILLADYQNGVDYGSGAAVTNWSTAAITQAAILSFTGKGTASSGSVYLDNINSTICYGVTVLTTGSIRMRKFNGTIWD